MAVDLMGRRAALLAEFGDYAIPPGFRPADFLQTQNYQSIIDTGVPGDDPTVAIDITIKSLGIQSYTHVLGNWKSEYARCLRLIQGTTTAPKNYVFTANTRRAGSSTALSVPNVTTIVGVKTHVHLEYGTCKIAYAGTTFTSTPTGDDTVEISDKNIAIGRSSVDQTSVDASRPPICYYDCQIRRQGRIIRSYTPLIRISDGKPGYYDRVNHTFSVSVGASDFLAGYDE